LPQAEGGIILPDRASLSISAIEDEEYKEDKINWWENVWGYNMKCIRDMAMQEPLVDVVEAKAICTDTFEMLVRTNIMVDPHRQQQRHISRHIDAHQLCFLRVCVWYTEHRHRHGQDRAPGVLCAVQAHCDAR